MAWKIKKKPEKKQGKNAVCQHCKQPLILKTYNKIDRCRECLSHPDYWSGKKKSRSNYYLKPITKEN